MTLVEELDEMKALLRLACADAVTLPAKVQRWWDAEKVRLAQEKAQKDAQRAIRRQELTDKIAELQKQLDALK